MFKSARIKLTFWYLGILMFVSLTFSGVVYHNATKTAERILDLQKRKIEKRFGRAVDLSHVEVLADSRRRSVLNLAGVNILIFLFGGGLSYVLSGVTLKPIEVMLGKQRRFISDAAHELKTPLTAMKTEMEVALRCEKTAKSDVKRILSSAVEEIDNLNLLVNKLLVGSRYNYTRTLSKSEIELSLLVDEIIEKLAVLAGAKNIKINKTCETCYIFADKHAISELITNLIENAIKYSKRDSEIKIDVGLRNNKVIFSVKDFGEGIDDCDLPYIFEPFYRGDKSRTRSETKGYGLGLSIVKEIADAHGAVINVKSNLGEGATFVVEFKNYSRSKSSGLPAASL